MSDLRGEQVGAYRLGDELGRGGMGVVYRARDTRVGREVAVKLINEAALQPELLLRFQREAELLARVRHANVVRVLEVGRSPRGPFLVTELVAGEDLGARLRRGPLPWPEACERVACLADAVAALHEVGVVHRDLKPDNVRLRPDGSPVLLDFGVARDPADAKLTQTGELVGTPAYMAPEQANRGSLDRLDPRADVYGLGALLLACLCARPPFGPRNSAIELLRAVVEEEPAWPGADDPPLPAGLLAVLRRAMAKLPLDRYRDAAALAAALRSVRESEQSGAARRRRNALGLVCLLALAALAGALTVAEDRSELPPASSRPPPLVSRAPTPPPQPSGEALPFDEVEAIELAKGSPQELLEAGHHHLAFVAPDVLVSLQRRSDRLYVWDLRAEHPEGVPRRLPPEWAKRTQKPGEPPPVRTTRMVQRAGVLVLGGHAASLLVYRYSVGRLHEAVELDFARGAPTTHNLTITALCFARDGKSLFAAIRGYLPQRKVNASWVARIALDGTSPTLWGPKLEDPLELKSLRLAAGGTLILGYATEPKLDSTRYRLRAWDTRDLSVFASASIRLDAYPTSLESSGREVLLGSVRGELAFVEIGARTLRVTDRLLLMPAKDRALPQEGILSRQLRPAHEVPSRALAFSPRGDWVASCSGNSSRGERRERNRGEVRVWRLDGRSDARSWVLRGSATSKRDYTDLDVSPDGRWIAAASWGSTVFVWPVPRAWR